MRRNEPDPIPKRFQSIEAASDFWDSHDAGDYEEALTPVTDPLRLNPDLPEVVVIEPALGQRLRRSARRHGVSLETLVNVWLEERLMSKRRRSPSRV